jgi:rhomboid protease GluP
MRPEAPPGARTPVCWWLFLSWVVVHVVALVMSGGVRAAPGPWWQWGSPTRESLVRVGGMLPELVRLGEWQLLLTYGFVHAFVLHLVLNAWVFLAVGRLLESVIGSARLFLVFAASVAGGGVAHLLFGDALMVGASGGVFGVVGALGLWSLWSQHPQAKAARATALIFLLFSAALFFLPSVANDAHIGGLVAGILAMVLLGPRRSERPAGAATRAAAWLALVAVAGGGALQVAASPAGPADETHAFLRTLQRAESDAGRLYDEPRLARPEQREALGRQLDALLATPFLEGWEGEEAFRTYVAAWRPVATGDIPDPFAFQAALDAATAAWTPHFERLRLGSGAAPPGFGR